MWNLLKLLESEWEQDFVYKARNAGFCGNSK